MMDDMLQMVMNRRHYRFKDPIKKAQAELKEPSPTCYDTFTECMWRLREALRGRDTVYLKGKEKKVIVRKPKK